MMNRFLFCLVAVTLVTVSSLHADDTIRAVQTRLKAGGFYSGKINGRNDSATAAAITRYQIRNGLQINGKLDGPTRLALGVAEGDPDVPLRGFGEEAWRSLRKTDQDYLQRLADEEDAVAKQQQSEKAPDSAANPAPPAAGPPNPESANFNRERLRDYVAAFVLAGLDPKVGAETEFFADRVNYFGKPDVPRETIRRDLQRYNDRWPQRAFTLAGELEIGSVRDNVKVTFPLRYDLRNASKHSTGKVLKTLVLARKGSDDLEIVSVDERKPK